MAKKIIMVLLSLCIALTSFGCGGTKTDSTKSVLYVANYDGGVGSEWLKEAITAFEKKYENESFEEGKTGVQVISDMGKTDHISQIATDAYNVIFAESVDVNSLIAKDQILDITDIVTATGEDGKTIESKMSASQKEMLSVSGGKYYALPHYEYYPGITYDKDLFDKKQFYICADGGYTNASGNLSAGPDGVEGTLDDGLPATIEQLLALCQHIRNEGCAPFIYGGSVPGYTDVILEGLTLSLQSTDSFMLNFTFDSTKGGTLTGDNQIKTEIITDVDTMAKENVTVSSKTGYKTYRQSAKYYALDTLHKIASNEDLYMSSAVSSNLNHTSAQREFIMSSLKNKEPVAMLLEGSFWYNEAKTANSFKDSVNQYGSKAENRNFGWMPFPTAVDGTVGETNGKENRLVDEANSFAVVNANIKNDAVKVKLAKLFLQFCYTDENLELFTKSTGCWKALNYTISDETYNSLDKFYQSIADIRRGTEVVRPISGNSVYINNQSSFMFMRTFYFKVKTSTVEYKNAYTAFKSQSVSAKDFFKLMWVSESDWNTKFLGK